MEPFSGTFTIDLRRLGALRELDRRGSLAKTAAALHLTPSAVSQQLSALSRELGVPLIERQGRGVRLTGQARLVSGTPTSSPPSSSGPAPTSPPGAEATTARSPSAPSPARSPASCRPSCARWPSSGRASPWP